MPEEKDFDWVTVDATSILGSSRPKNVEGLLKKSEVWHQLYQDWLDRHHTDHVVGFQFIERSGGRPRLQGRELYDQWMAALNATFDTFYGDVGDLKQLLDSRTGAGRRLAHLAAKSAGAVKQAAESAAVTKVASVVGAQPVQKLAASAAGAAQSAVGPGGPQSAPDMAFDPAQLLVDSADLDGYLQWVEQLSRDFGWYGGRFGEVGARLGTLGETVSAWRVELGRLVNEGQPPQSVRRAATDLAFHVCMAGPETQPHRVVAEVVNDLHQRSAAALYQLAHPWFVALMQSLDTMYYYGEQALVHADVVIGRPVANRMAALRTDVVAMALPDPVDAERTDVDEVAARELFERSFDDFR
jgi:hypothetical protein